MSRSIAIVPPAPIEGDILIEATISPAEMASMNFARQEFDTLSKLLAPFLDIYMCRHEEGIGCDIARHLEQIRTFSGNFCWNHRHLGKMHNALDVRGMQ
ncbi:hypothetical protein M2401_005010 [Pseudomonas sp. JUb42]|uniref:hypothetical protein n=1 Tax=Pseudomonas sp. JUb42 TaxID=2940611 RepID=UPI002166DF8F|nr:hypothetical protein [Pseudomonas sp. JUb42]MCS3471248.1 hypothetical protein [Pseudomonas sp. JUb42]